jgi:hypothetical protein
VNDFLVSGLDAIDERLLEYLDEYDGLSPDAVRRSSRLPESFIWDSHLPCTGGSAIIIGRWH